MFFFAAVIPIVKARGRKAQFWPVWTRISKAVTDAGDLVTMNTVYDDEVTFAGGGDEAVGRYLGFSCYLGCIV